MMRKFEWLDGFTPYSATLDGRVLAEYAGDVPERVSVLTRSADRDGSALRSDYRMTDDLSIGPDVDGVDVAWIDGHAFTLTPAGDFPCCIIGHDDTRGGAR